MKKKIIAAFILTTIMLINFGFKTYKANYHQPGDNKNYRLYEKKSYQILDTAAFYLYYRYQNRDKPKGEALMKTGVYFFSRDAGSPIELLTADNLKRAFPDNHSFHYAIDAQFKTNDELIAYDSYSKCYKLKYVYKQSLK
jgi:hypothetical protein